MKLEGLAACLISACFVGSIPIMPIRESEAH